MYLYLKLKNQDATITKLYNSKFKNNFIKSFEYFLLDHEVPIVLNKNFCEDMVQPLTTHVKTYEELYDDCKSRSNYLSQFKINSLQPCAVKEIDGRVYIKCLCSDAELIKKYQYKLECTVTMNLPEVVTEWVNHEYRDNDDLSNAKNAIKNIVPLGIIILEDEL